MWHIKALGLEVRNMLGSGSFAQVYQCYDHKLKKEYAVKIIKKQTMNKSRVRAFFKQAQILEAMDHKNIVKFHSFHQTDQHLLIKMELIRGGTLKKLIEKRKGQRIAFREEEIAIFLRNLLEGIRYLHNLNIIHRDLKTENILFADDDDLTSVKIVDFGLSAKLEINCNKNVKAQCGTLLYMAPEIFNKPSYTKSVDIWSCAVIMFMMFNQGNHPYYIPGMKTQDFKHKLKMLPFPALNHPLAQNFIEKLSKKEYEERYNVNQAIKHPWITRNKDDEIPLSIHESYKSFDSTHEIITVLKLFLTMGTLVPHRRAEIDESYRFKVNDFVSSNEVVRVYSPSRRKMRDKNNELFVKMKQIFHIQGQSKPQDEMFSDISQDFSPTIKKHDSIFSRLFDKDKSEKSFQITKQMDTNQQKIELINLQDSPNESFVSNLNSQRYTKRVDPEIAKNEVNILSKTTFIDRKVQQKVENQIEESVNYIKMFQKPDQKRRIFSKKQSFEDKEILGQKKASKLMKKYSDNYEIERAEQISRNNKNLTNNLETSNKQIYNRRPMSPLKNSYKPMVFSLTSRTYQNYHSKKYP